ncbi:MAG: hypothetical protein IOMNBAOH_00175 [Rhodocyclaceae bacterium]|nr:hypothetical protein [Rhodocyclaceae bacterium]
MIFARTTWLMAGLWLVLSMTLLAPDARVGATGWGVEHGERDSSASWFANVDAWGAAELDMDDASDHVVIDTSHAQWEPGRAQYALLWFAQLPTEPPAVFLRPPDAT